MAQETYPKPEVQLWGLPVGLSLIIAAIAMTFYVNQGVDEPLTTIVGVVALPLLGAGIVSLGAFIYSLIRRAVYQTEAKRFSEAH